MNREEEILNASADTFISCGDEFTRAIKMLWVTAFIAGAAWADKHPKNVWHDADEEPDNLVQIVCVCNMFGSRQVCSFRVDKGNLIEWKRIVEIRHIDKWAYFNELIED